jgi:hypothetical protein
MTMLTWHEIMTGNQFDSYSSYGGSLDHANDFVLLSRTRDSGVLDNSNFDCAIKALGGESETVYTLRFGHWAVGWVEHLFIDSVDKHAVKIAEEIESALADYPVLDESDYSDREWNLAAEIWEHMSISDRVELCQEYRLSVFAARHDWIPEKDNGSLFDYLAREC